MNLTLLFHRGFESRYGNSLKTLDKVFQTIRKDYLTVLPGQVYPNSQRFSVCLTFDDATFDFYYLIYPLLKKYRLKALLCVPTSYILNDSDRSFQERLSQVKKSDQLDELSKHAFCSWQELKEMSCSGFVEIASHGHYHKSLSTLDVEDLDNIKKSKQILESNLEISVESFAFPYGRTSKDVNLELKKLFKYIFRIGNAMNFHWNQKVLHRINCDRIRDIEQLFNRRNMLKYLLKGGINQIRGF